MNGASPIIAYAVAISEDGSHIYICGVNDLYGSMDGGANWSLLYNDATKQVEFVECNANGSIIVINTYGGRIFRSVDYGVNWTEPRPAGNVNKYWDWGMSRDAQVIIACTGTAANYISTDGGTNWSALGIVGVQPDSFGLDYDGSVRLVGVNGGRSYQYIDSAWVEIYPHQDCYFKSYFGLVYHGGSFNSTGARQVICSTGTFGRIYLSEDYGATWVNLDPWGDADEHDWRCVRMSGNGNVIVAGTGTGERLYTSVDGGSTWVLGLIGDLRPSQWVDCAVNNDGSIIYGVSEGTVDRGIFKSTDYGATFSDISPTPKKSNAVYSLIACDGIGNTIFTTIYYANESLPRKMFLSTNAGASWIDLGYVPYGAGFNYVDVSEDGSTLARHTSSGGYLSISTDAGVSWNNIDFTTGLEAAPEGGTWSQWGVRFSRDGSCIAVALSTLFPYYHSDFVLSFDYGATWTALQGPPITGRGKGWENFTLSDDGTRITACGYSGSVWTGIYTEDTNEWPDNGTYEAVVIHGDPIEPSTNALKSQTVVRTTWELPFPWQYIECPPDGVVEYRRIRAQTTTPFWTGEKSLSSSQPIELHMFATPTTVWRYADAPININYTGGGIVTFRGSVLSVSFEQNSRDGNREAIITIDPYTNDFGSNGLTWRYDRNCSTSLYTDACGILRDSWKVTGTLTSITNQVELAATEFSTKADGWFVGGDILIGDFRRKIMYHVGDTIRISRRIPDLAIGNTFTAWAGCDRTLDTCITKFDNKNNFRGSPFIPEVNPTGVNGIV